MFWRYLFSAAARIMGISSNSRSTRASRNSKKPDVTFNWGNLIGRKPDAPPATYHREGIVFASSSQSHGEDAAKVDSSRSNSQWSSENPAAGVSDSPVMTVRKIAVRVSPYGIIAIVKGLIRNHHLFPREWCLKPWW